MDITQLLTFGVQQGASDCHLSAGEPPMLRIHGDLKKLDHPPQSKDEVHNDAPDRPALADGQDSSCNRSRYSASFSTAPALSFCPYHRGIV